MINAVCDRALLGAYVQEQSRVDVKTLKRAAREVFGDKTYRRRGWLRYRAGALGLLLLLLVVFGAFYYAPKNAI